MGTRDFNWNYKYSLAKAYYEYHGNLEIPHYFKTKNGYEYDENGITLGSWIDTQRQTYNGKRNGKINKEQIALLKQIGMRFETNKHMENWNYKYSLAKAYYEHYGNLEVSRQFKTKNGYDSDNDGILLGSWVNNQRQIYKGKGNGKITKEQIELLKQIGMRFETSKFKEDWNYKYKLAKAYYEHYGNLEVPISFKTQNGYEKDENGIALGSWIDTQRQTCKGKGSCKITNEQIELLKQIEMRFETNKHTKDWKYKYKLAKAYYEHHGNLEVPIRFKTKNGYEKDENGIALGSWIDTQRQAYKGKVICKMSTEQVVLLDQIGMVWMSENVDHKQQIEVITEKNNIRKQIEILNRVKSYLNTYQSNSLPSKEKINEGLLKKLNVYMKK